MSVKKTVQSPAISDGLPIAEFVFSENKKQISALFIGEEPWFIAKDACEALELTDTAKSIEKLDEDEKLIRKVFVSGQDRDVWLVNESGLYNLIFRSSKPIAKAFRRWVTHELLPEIRKKGSYTVGNNMILPENSVLFAGLKVVKINGTRFYPYRAVARRIGIQLPKSGMGSTYTLARKLEPECFLNIDDVATVSEVWINRKVKQIELSQRRLILKNGGKP